MAVVGWIATHALTLRAQAKNFRNQLLDRARMEIARELHEYQDWLGRIYSTLMWVSSTVALEAKGIAAHWDGPRRNVSDLIASHRAGSKWSLALEEYESLFPETRQVRIELLKREDDVLRILDSFSSKLMLATFPGSPLAGREALASWGDAQQSFVLDQQSLVSDLLVHLQNASLHRITGAKVPLRKPEDPSVPMIAAGVNGMLEIVPAARVLDAPKTVAKP